MKKDSKIYVAGHGGLVGSAIWRCLEKKGYTNLIGKTHRQLDLLDQPAVSNFFKNEKPEYVFLAAAKVGGIMANSTYRGEFIYENLMIQNNVIHNAWKYGVKKLLFLGSTCIYPKAAPQPIKEEYLLTSPLENTNEPYAIAKIAGIKLCESYNMQYGTNFISVMPTNLYGPNDNFDLEKSHVLPALLRKFHLGSCLEKNYWPLIRKDLNKRPVEGINGESPKNEILTVLKKYGLTPTTESQKCAVEIWGSGKPKREFLWSEEMADACVFLMENTDFKDIFHGKDSSVSEEQIKASHINIGTGNDISIRDLALLISQITGFNGELKFNIDKPDGTTRKVTDVTKLHSMGWHHHIELDEGLKKMYEWYINNQ